MLEENFEKQKEKWKLEGFNSAVKKMVKAGMDIEVIAYVIEKSEEVKKIIQSE